MRLHSTRSEAIALRHMRGHQQALVLAQGQLASGMRITGASVDAAGLSMVSKLGAQVRGFQASQRAMQDGLSMLRLADGGMAGVMANLQAMRELTMRATGPAMTPEDRAAVMAELAQLSAGIDGIVDGTHFNTLQILGKGDSKSTQSPATLLGRSPIALRPPAAPTTATLLGGVLSLNTSTAVAATRARLTSGAIALDLSAFQPAKVASLTGGLVTRNLNHISGPTTAAIMGGAVTLDTRTAQAASAAWMESTAISLDLSQATAATPASKLMGPVVLNSAPGTPGTAATLTSARVQITSGGNPATLKGSNINLTGNSTDFGSIEINGVITHLGVYPPPGGNYDPNDRDAASQWISEKINADPNSTVTAVVGSNDKRIELVSKAKGTSSVIEIGTATSSRTGFTPGERKTGSGGTANTDLGQVTINGTQVNLGLLDNAGLTTQKAAQHVAARINQSLGGTLTATVGGTFGDQIVLTTLATGAAASLAIQNVQADSNGTGADNGFNGFTAPTTATGSGGVPARTDLGAVTIDGVTTTFGTLSNAGLTTQLAAQHMVSRINSNAASTVIASLGGSNGDQVLLTAKVAGVAGFTVQAVTNDSNAGSLDDGQNGFTLGSATGQAGNAGTTDFGALTIGGTTVTLGAFDNNGKTAQDAVSWIIGKINGTASLSVDATAAAGDKIHLTAKTAGTAGNFTLTSTTPRNGFTGGTATGVDADAGRTDFGTIAINGTAITLGVFDNNGKTAQDAAQWLIDRINLAAVPVTASLSGNQIRLLSDTPGAAGAFTLAVTPDSNGNPLDDGSHGLTAWTATALDADYGRTDFGSLNINGSTVALGLFDNNSGDDAAAAQWIVDRINAAGVAVTASRNANQLTLTAKTAGTAGNFTLAVTPDSNGDATDNGSHGFSNASATGQDANAGVTDFGTLSIGGTTVTLGAFDNNGKTALDAAQWIASRINGTAGISVDATIAPGNQLLLTAKAAGSAGNFTLTSTTVRNGFTDGPSLPGTDADAGKTDFGTITIGSKAIALGLFDNTGKTAQDAAQWIISQINAQAGDQVTASLSGGRIHLTSKTSGAAGNFTVSVQSDSNGLGADDGSHGLVSGTTTSGQDGSSGLTDFGRLTINGKVITLGTFDSTTTTAAAAAAHLAGLITAAGAGVEATVQSGRLVLRSLDPEADLVITDVSSDSNGDASDDSAVGFLSGDRDAPGASDDPAGAKTLSQGIVIQLGSGAGETITLKTPLDAYAETLGVSAASLDVSSFERTAATLNRIDEAISRAGDIRTLLGASMNRVEHALTASMATSQNLTTSKSRIMDADAAQSVLSMTRSQIASLSAQAMLQYMHVSRANLLSLLG